MSENLFEPLADSLALSCKSVVKSINSLLGLNTLVFRKLFEESDE